MKENLKTQNKQASYRWLYVIFGIIIMLCLGTVYSWSVFRLAIENLYDVGSTESGFPYMTALSFYALSMFLTGRYLDKYSPKVFIITGGILVSLGWILSSFAPNIYILTVTYGIISGIGVGIVYGAPMTVVAKWFPEKKGLAVGLVLIGFGLSPLITAPLARNLVEMYGVLRAFLLMGISFGVIIPLLSFPFKYPLEFKTEDLKTIKGAEKEHLEINTSRMIKSNSFKGLYFNFIIGSMIGLMLVGMTSSVGTKMIGLSPTTVTLLMILFAICNGIGRPVFGWLTDKLSTRKAMFISYGMISLAALLILLAKTGSLVLFAIAFSIFWFNLGGWLAIAPTSTLSMYGTKYYSQNYGLVFTAYGLGAIIGVVTSGILIDAQDNYYLVFYYVLALCLIGSLLTLKFVGKADFKNKAEKK